MDLYDEIRVLPLFNRSAFFLLLLNFKGLSFFVVYKKWIKHADSKNERRRDKKKTPQDKINHVHDELLLFYISEWIKINQVLNVDFQPLKKPFFFSFFWQCFYDLLRMIKQSKSGVRVGTINRRITAPSQRPVDRKSREVKPTDRSSNGCCLIL